MPRLAILTSLLALGAATPACSGPVKPPTTSDPAAGMGAGDSGAGAAAGSRTGAAPAVDRHRPPGRKLAT